MPTPNYSDPQLIQVLQSLGRRLSSLEQAFQGVKDANGLTRVKTGLLPGGDYGIALTDPVTGVTTELLPVYQESDRGNDFSTSSTSYVADTNTPALTATVGASGDVLLTVNSFIGIPGATGGAQSGGFVGISVDGAAITGILDEVLYLANSVVGTTAVGQAANQSAQVIVTGLSPGQHTFEMQYKMIGPGTVNYASRFLQARPL